ncbi:MAG: hypothetical protein OXF79_30775 [Chloroflexi bacterium]|nr:hypothetical protein [Chloroflexota bacterium]
MELLITRLLAGIPDRRWAESGEMPGGWVFLAHQPHWVFREADVFPSPGQRGRGAKFWYHEMRSCFITVADGT